LGNQVIGTGLGSNWGPIKISVFDVTNPTSPKRTAAYEPSDGP